MIIIDPHPFVFKQVKAMLKELCDKPKYEKVMVVLGYNVMPCSEALKLKEKHPDYKLVVYNLEQLYVGSPWLNANTRGWFMRADEIWDYNLENIKFFSEVLGYRASYHPI
jgi:hypothetical protein